MTFSSDRNVPSGPGNQKGMKFETLMLHVGQEEPDPVSDARATPIYLTTSYVFDNCDDAADRFALKTQGNIYSRLTNTTTDVFERRVAALEGGTAALAVASGAAAIAYTINNLAFSGDHIVSSTTIYGGTYNLFGVTMKKMGIECTFVDQNISEEELLKLVRPNTKAIFGETITNPTVTVFDFEKFAKLAHDHGVPLIVDNTFATPVNCRPFEWGADIVTHSTTKYMDGHGAAVGGCIVDSGKFDWSASGKYPAISDPNPSYHGVSFVKAAGAAAFVTYIRAECGRTELTQKEVAQQMGISQSYISRLEKRIMLRLRKELIRQTNCV